MEVQHDEVSLPGGYHTIPATLIGWGLHQEAQECIWVVAFDAELTVKTVVEVARGTYVRAKAHLPTLIAAVVTAGCERFILAHNHPSNVTTPSQQDHDLTRTVMTAANAAGLYFEDHIILAPSGKWHSMTLAHEMKPADYAAHAAAASPMKRVRSIWEGVDVRESG
jgi:hypothetical protein